MTTKRIREFSSSGLERLRGACDPGPRVHDRNDAEKVAGAGGRHPLLRRSLKDGSRFRL